MTSRAPSIDRPAPNAAAPTNRSALFAKLAWGAVGYTLLVILFGAVVRITGSGAGCGQHWPTCHGEVAHLPASTETAIELGHRVTSGLSLLVVVGVCALAFRWFEPRSLVRRAAVLSVVLMIVEALIGAGLVLLELVGKNASAARAVWMSAHLVNTSLLVFAMVTTAWAPTRREGPRASSARLARLLAVGLFGVLVVSVTGAVTALGDTLYPVEPGADLAARIASDQGVAANFLERGRIVHPLVAVVVAGWILFAAARAADRSSAMRRWARTLSALVYLQVSAGVVNVLLSAPGWMQVTHLLIANLLWMSLVILWLEARSTVAEAP